MQHMNKILNHPFGRGLALTLACSLGTPVAWAAPHDTIAVVEVYDGVPNKDLSELRFKLEKQLMQSKKVQVVAADKIAGYFNGESEGSDSVAQTAGDRQIADAQMHFLNFEYKEAIAVLDQAIPQLQRQPGVAGGLVKAYLLKAQADLELGNNDEAIKSTEAAVAADVSHADLDAYAYSPKMQRFYKKVFQSYVAKNHTVDLTVTVRGGRDLAVYINGVRRGVGPVLTVKVPENGTFLVSAGSSAQGPVVSASAAQNTVTVGGRDAVKVVSARKPVGFKNSDQPTLVENAIMLGAAVNAQKVALVRLEETNLVNRMTVTVVDVRSSSASAAKQIDVVDVRDDAESAASVAADYVTGLSKSAYAKVDTGSDLPVLIGKKSKKMSPLLLGAIGAVVLGAGAGIALSMGGKSSSSSSSASVSGDTSASVGMSGTGLSAP